MTPLSEFEAIYLAHYEAVTRFAARRVPNDAVHDVVSETFLTAWRRFAELNGDPLPWLLGIARRVSANQLRGSKRRMALTDRIGSEERSGSSGTEEGDSEVRDALLSLQERDREALMLVAWDGLTNRQAAAVVGCSATAFAVRLHRARGRLKRALENPDRDPVDLPKEVSVLR